MGRFEKRPDNPRVRGDLSRAAETALWAVVEDLESLQQNVLRSLQEEIKRLQADKNRLSDEIQQLREEKEHLQQVRQITEQQVLIRQLSEALAKHISSQLQSSLTSLVSKSVESNSQPAGDNNQKAEEMLGTLDDTLTITFNSLQQELKNYQNNLSQQLSRMQSQQQQGETIVEDFINHLRGELVKTTKEISLATVKPSPPTVLQPTEEQPPRSSQTNLQSEVFKTSDIERTSRTTLFESNDPPASTIPLAPETSQPPTTEQNSFISNDLSGDEIYSPPESREAREENSFISNDLSGDEIYSPPESREASEQNSFISPNLSGDEIYSPPESREAREENSFISPNLSGDESKSSPVPPKSEPISVISTNLSGGESKSPPVPPKSEPISVISRESSERKTKPLNSQLATEPKAKLTSSQSSSSQGLSPVQIGFLLIVLSTVVSSLYNIAIKGMFFKAYDNFGVLEIQGIISPTLGNILLILMLRLIVVVPLMLLLAPMMHSQVWEDIQSIFTSLRGNSSRNPSAKKQSILQLSIASGGCLFLSQVLIYLAIGQIETGMAIALFFIYPMMTGLLSWLFFRHRPSGFHSAAIAAIFCGQLLVLGGSASIGMANFSLGSSSAIFGGVAFACYVILTRLSATQLHPVSCTLIHFTTMLVLSFICLMIPLPSNLSIVVEQSNLLELILSAFILGVLTLLGYVLNNIGFRKLGALRSAIIGAGVPLLTVVFAGLILQETLAAVQIMGVLFVSFGVAAYSFEIKRTQPKPSSSQK
ncbi:EamA family transporter [Nodularia harveyana UHCC-0300]|uniref:EamA family transporter n=1 Tax=Nodularia harveyana UHCC-0300 TaxID=2974287 RepID=A0ABU5U9G6_9CYAN|nr:EamA family transporter [Nodularia harveyana]MEA5579825.1 EamA family transporter [Nodularia harveyana UHCC-0300]